MLRQLTENNVKITVECLPEDIPILGNCMASDEARNFVKLSELQP